MTRKLEYTPRSKVRSALRQLWLRSREHSKALKNANYTCERCGVKQSKAKGKEVRVEVHHIYGIDWEYIIDEIYKEILCSPVHLEVLCEKCHKEEANVDDMPK